MLMMDSVALVRRKIEDSSEAFHDETLNSVVTLAAIEVSFIPTVIYITNGLYVAWQGKY